MESSEMRRSSRDVTFRIVNPFRKCVAASWVAAAAEVAVNNTMQFDSSPWVWSPASHNSLLSMGRSSSGRKGDGTETLVRLVMMIVAPADGVEHGWLVHDVIGETLLDTAVLRHGEVPWMED